MKMHENEHGLCIDLDMDDIKELATATWIELCGSDACETMVVKIVKECERIVEEINDQRN